MSSSSKISMKIITCISNKDGDKMILSNRLKENIMHEDLSIEEFRGISPMVIKPMN